MFYEWSEGHMQKFRQFWAKWKNALKFDMRRLRSQPFNCTYTINLLHCPFGVDFVDVIDGPSNGNLLLLFFEEAVNLTRADGTAVPERGDTVILDNCGFHRGHFVEPILREMLGECGVNLFFQPPYSPEFNSCEFCFHDIKEFLRKHHTSKICCLFSTLWTPAVGHEQWTVALIVWLTCTGNNCYHSAAAVTNNIMQRITLCLMFAYNLWEIVCKCTPDLQFSQLNELFMNL